MVNSDIINAKWEDLYSSVEDLVKDFLKIDLDTFKKRSLSGTNTIKSYKEYYKIKGEFTNKQITQIKRMAKEVYKYHNWNW